MNDITICNHDVLSAAKAALVVVRFVTHARGNPFVDNFVADLRSSLGGKALNDALPVIAREIVSPNTSYEEALLTLAAIATIIDEQERKPADV